MDNKRSIFVFLCLLSVKDITILSQKSWNWFQAQEECKANEDTLKSSDLNGSNEEYWTGFYQRYSSLIGILGCFEYTGKEQREVTDYNMRHPSAGLCQELCSKVDSEIFGIQLNTCRCFPKKPSVAPVSSVDCDKACPKSTQRERFGECGGSKTFTLYKSVFNGQVTPADRCVSIQCGMNVAFTFQENCSLSYQAACQTTDTYTQQSWIASMQKCKPSYLEGNVSLSDARSTCQALSSVLNGSFWLGIANELYMGSDRGFDIDKNDRQIFHQCQKCSSTGCEFTECNERLNSLYCKEGLKGETGQSEISTPVIRSSITTKSQNPPKDSNNLIIIMVSVIAVSIVCIGMVVFLLIRRWKQKSTKGDRKTNASRIVEPHYADINDDRSTNMNYFILAPQAEVYEHSNSEKDKSSNAYMQTNFREGVYDHLQNHKVMTNKEENTYDQTSTVKEREYDISLGMNEDNLDDSYDHAVFSTRYEQTFKTVLKPTNSDYS
ncbi:uncharacterized protein LOC125663541 isoform X2 [Ostrea edulis]|uniref:uncharacterized protein LOC125663541 isoform X2 n=1 Tax=Ostrea edulis TaxID=37623 RepID=UPI0024AF6C23|nr:uncharacterized protein LOC125663541 isoform X2 [Ostrea edulis]